MWERIRKLQDNVWDFKMSSLKLRRLIDINVVKTDKEILRQSSRLASVGEIGRAYRTYLGDERRIIPDKHVFPSLSEKYVAVGNHGMD